MDALLNMKTGKSADGEGIFAEHLHYAPLLMFKRLSSMFNAMLNHSFVPHQFRFGFMVPIIKDQSGNHADTSNYRGITISPAISKLFEHVLKLSGLTHYFCASIRFQERFVDDSCTALSQGDRQLLHQPWKQSVLYLFGCKQSIRPASPFWPIHQIDGWECATSIPGYHHIVV